MYTGRTKRQPLTGHPDTRMRLSKIKLAGFKSFVDPTTIKFPSNLTGIVGPNGCGKSNVIDAVRWVMGESSAKHLRGSSMEDVIFSGSSARKPVGMASVELVFDNFEGKVGGQFAQYSEISVKRQVTRDGQSKYFLNGARCRRKDIADLFLGTGLGPRSYAIIEQGMISRLIEAKPEELRVFLEEAAGISKYKERRRETENRIRHTRDNLSRLEDLREEIDSQLARLQRQSKAAEKYKQYKAEERKLKAEQLSLRWRELKAELDKRDREIADTEIKLEKVIAEQRRVESEIEQQRQLHTESNDALNKVQEQYYNLGAEISRTEQSIKHQQDLQQRQTTDLERIEASLQSAVEALQADRDAIAELERNLANDKPQLETLRAEEQQISEQYQQAEDAMQQWQHGWDEINQQYSEASQQAQVQRSRMEQLERHIDQLKQRLHRIDAEQQALRGEDIEAQIAELQQKLDAASQDKQQKEQTLSDILAGIRSARENIVATEQQHADKRKQLHELQGRLASLEALQQAALGKTDASVKQWIERKGLADKKRFAEQLTVDNGWELAVETVLGDTLEAVCVDQIAPLCDSLQELADSNLALIETRGAATPASQNADLLASKVKSDIDINAFIGGVYAAEDLQGALAMRASLKPNESVVTRDGVWMGANWVRIIRDKDAQQGVLAREAEIRKLNEQLAELEQQSTQLGEQLQAQREALQQAEQQREEAQVELNNAHALMNDLQGQINARQTRQEHISKRGSSLEEEKADVEAQIASDSADIEEATRLRNAALQQIEQLAGKRSELESQRDSLRDALIQQRTAMQQQKDRAHELAIRIEGMTTRLQSLQQNIQRLQNEQETLEQRKQDLSRLLSQSTEPLEQLEITHKQLLEQRLQSEEALNEARRKLGEVADKLQRLEQERSEHEQHSQRVREQLQQLELNSQEVRVRSKTTLEQLAETGFEAEPLLAELSEDATSREWEERLAKMAQRISRLGPINLAAIDEYQEQLKRKEYLDEQYEDVTAALTTLEEAIAKIDHETKTRFKETFDHVSGRLKEMFPRLFGGGTAYLEMTGDDLLSTGVAVMAKPPGKRISNIHLMSGGEKALTAVALVFAIFELNPAPFCMLDEVDAPLDEANVGRFSQLVKDMSENVQFIFITHNKTTMEISEHLTGVTMREAGVSRTVSVDVAEAATMAAV